MVTLIHCKWLALQLLTGNCRIRSHMPPTSCCVLHACVAHLPTSLHLPAVTDCHCAAGPSRALSTAGSTAPGGWTGLQPGPEGQCPLQLSPCLPGPVWVPAQPPAAGDVLLLPAYPAASPAAWLLPCWGPGPGSSGPREGWDSATSAGHVGPSPTPPQPTQGCPPTRPGPVAALLSTAVAPAATVSLSPCRPVWQAWPPHSLLSCSGGGTDSQPHCEEGGRTRHCWAACRMPSRCSALLQAVDCWGSWAQPPHLRCGLSHALPVLHRAWQCEPGPWAA
ncbi:hypothetical protein V8C86DRAFT_1204946 [Haematococcus lacustris]